ncbi:carbohydrate ABC transporter permease [Streptomyces litchfieldiae]|uniref:Sugar ABC transporter permease n=1 Tax=Streptomyces litchfieldiae TaxID=3075543 RepID=A0ABU2MRN7_9ACTN|nr:sugar ABC transporter permease [Streptomyces sp. DSM 44938]MDT0344261.1 sugar ABC transporter permease [Streptomyces sp. DSM 44938]
MKGAAFAAPFFIGFLFVFVVPVGYAVYESLFTERSSGLGIGGQEKVFVGFDNFSRGLSDGDFWAGVSRVLAFACVQIPVMLALALTMALLLDSIATRTAHRYRLAFLIPYMIPGIVAALMWMYLYSPRLGPLTDVLDAVGIDANFYSSNMLWISMGNLLTWHGVGYNMLIIYGALRAVPREIFDAARVDGASELRIALSIKVPFVRGALVLTGMLSIIGMLQIFNEPLLFRQVAPETVTKSYTPIMLIYYQAFDSNDYGYAAALSVILAVIVGAISFLFYKLTNRPHS